MRSSQPIDESHGILEWQSPEVIWLSFLLSCHRDPHLHPTAPALTHSQVAVHLFLETWVTLISRKLLLR